MEQTDEILAEVEIALNVAKRVRRESTIAVQTLAQLRDNLQPTDGHKENDDRGRSTAS